MKTSGDLVVNGAHSVAKQLTSLQAGGTPPFVVASNSQVLNLYVARAVIADNVTINANLTGHVTSVGNAAVLGSFTSANLLTALSTKTGTGLAVFATSPTLVTPILGVATGTSFQGIVGNVTPATGAFTSLSATTTLALVTTTSSTTGVITKGGNRFIHNYAGAGSDGQNIFCGLNAGNFTMGTGGGASTLASYNSVGGGVNVLLANTTGSYNSIGAGYQTLFSNTTGYYNSVGAGVFALYLNTTGFSNSVGAGLSALFSNTTGNSNSVGAGIYALYSNTTGANNSVGAGVYALYFNTTASFNSVGAGSYALYANTTGANNSVGAGYRALYSNTTGYNNSVGAGYQALFYNTTGINNSVGAGAYAIQANTTGNLNSVGAGFNALYSNTIGDSNSVGAGAHALYSNTAGINNSVGAGASALYDVTTGSNNTAVGYNTGRGITTGSGNSIFGVNVTGLAAGLANNIILASGAGIKAQHDGTNWALTGAVAVTGALTSTTGFGANGNAAQTKATVNAASTDLASVIALCNQIRTALVANGICV